MDPLSIAAACVGLLSALTTVSTKIRSLTIDAKNTNKEVSALQSELDSFQRSLGVFYGSGLADNYPGHLRSDLDKIIRQCQYIVDDIDHLLDKVASANFSQRVQWSFSVRDEVIRLHRNLEGHKSAITIAIAFASMSMNSGIKSDTSSIRSKAARIPEMQQQLAAVFEAIQTLNHGDPSQRPQMSLAMQRFLQEAYTESISGSLLRSNSSRTYGSIPPSMDDPFEDPKSEIETSVIGDTGLEVDVGYHSGSTILPHSTTALGAESDRSRPHEAIIQVAEPFETATRGPPDLRTTSIPIQPNTMPPFTKVRKAVAPNLNETMTNQKPRFSLGRLRQRRSSLVALPDRQSKASYPPVTWDSILALRDALFNFVSTVIFAYDPALSQSAQEMFDLRSKQALSMNKVHADALFQTAIQTHQSGDIESATSLLETVAESGHISSQIMYALSLRHGLGCTSDPRTAFAYLYSAASMVVDFQYQIGQNGTCPIPMPPDELTLALFEIANSARHGWGCQISAVYARSFYKVAADLGDVDAMHELAWCYVTGFGGKKEKVEAAQVLRRAEWQGSKVPGNSWIWKEKYNAVSR